MASSSRTKLADRQAVLKKLLPLVKKQYPKVTIPKLDRPVMETMLYAVCLENATVEQADAAYAKFCQLFPDLNEARVSSISEMEPAFAGMDGVDWRAFRMRAILQYVFDKTYNFEFESLRKKTLELATKQLAKIRHLSPFVRTFTLQQVVGAHVLPIDAAMAQFLAWMGLATLDQPLDEIGESLKSSVRKAEAHQFCFSIRCMAADPKFKAAFDPVKFPAPTEGYDPNTGIDRLTSLLKNGVSSIKPRPAPEPVAEPSKKTAKPKAVAPSPVPAAKATSVKSSSTSKEEASPPRKIDVAATAAKKTAPVAKKTTKSAPVKQPPAKPNTKPTSKKSKT